MQVVSTLLLAASCSASLYGAVSTQYVSQDGHGQYSYGYSEPNSQKHETKTGDVVQGGYSYVDGHGIFQSVKYSSDPIHGFQVAATNLPKGPVDPAHAIVPAHYAPAPVSYIAPISYHAAPISYASTYSAPTHYASVSYGHAGLPQPVQDTPEVAAAKIAHFAAHAQAKANLHHLYKRSAWQYAPSSWSHAAAPAIHNGVPVETPEVQQAKAAHFAAHAAAAHGSAYAPAHYAPAPAHYSAPAHYAAPVIHNGVPVDTPEVQHAKAAHFAAVAEAQARSHSAPSHYHQEPAQYAPAHHAGAYHIPVIHNGVPVETPEVQHAKAAHFAAVAEAQSRSGYGHGQESYAHDNSWDDGRNSWDNGHNDW